MKVNLKTAREYLDELPYKYRVELEKHVVNPDERYATFSMFLEQQILPQPSAPRVERLVAFHVAYENNILQEFRATEDKLIDKYNELIAITTKRMLSKN
jgi:hypothetical protein